MRKDTFEGYGTDLHGLFAFAKGLLTKEAFTVQSESVGDGVLDLHAHRSGVRSIAHGVVRDFDLVISGAGPKFQVQLRAGVWGRDLQVPTVGVEQNEPDLKQLYSAHELEKKIWGEIVNKIDPSLRICSRDGLTFKTDADFKLHIDMHDMLRETVQTERYLSETGLMRDL